MTETDEPVSVIEALQQLTRQVAELTEQLRSSAVAEQVPPLLMTVEQAAGVLGVSPAWLVGQARAGLVEHRRLGRTYRFTSADLDDITRKSLRRPDPDRVLDPDTLVDPDNPWGLTARALASLRRGRVRREGPYSTPRQLGPYDVPGVMPGTVPDPSRPKTVRIVCSGVGRPVSAAGRAGCPDCGRGYVGVWHVDSATQMGTIGRHVAYIPVGDLKPEHLLWPGGERGRQRPPAPQ